MTVACECAANWRVELVLLSTGEVLDVVVPISFEFETGFLTPGRGSITFHRRVPGFVGVLNPGSFVATPYIPQVDMYPRRVGIYISRVAGGVATGLAPVTMFAGIVDTFQGASDGVITIGFFEIQQYLNYRTIRSDLTFTAVDQTDIGAQLVLYARGENTLGGSVDPDTADGIRLFGVSSPTIGTNRDRTYLAADRPFIGKMIDNLVGVIDGPVYRLSHVRASGIWTTTMTFYDEIPQTVVKTISAKGLTDFQVKLEGNDLANLIDAFGKPSEDGTPLISTNLPANDGFLMPRYDATPSFPTVSDPVDLAENAAGYDRDHYDAASEIQLFYSGLEYNEALNIDDLVPGNQVDVDVISQHWELSFVNSVDASSRIGRVSVSVPTEGPEQVSVQITSSNTRGGGNGFFYPCVDC